MKTHHPFARLAHAAACACLISASAHAATITGTANGPNGSNDTWNNAANWSPAGVPTATAAATIGSGVSAKVDNSTTPTYSGGLVLEVNAKLQVGWTTTRAANINAIGSGSITLKNGSEIISRSGLGTYTFTQPIIMTGNGIIWAGISTANGYTTKTFSGGVSGPGTLTYNGILGTNFIFNTANPGWTGGIQTADPQNQKHKLTAAANGCFGTGNVTINKNCSLEILSGLGDVIDLAATLSLNGVPSSDLVTKLVLSSNETVGKLFIDGVQQNAGTYSATSSFISGGGILTVVIAPGADAVMALPVTFPPDNATNARDSDTLVLTFSKPVVALTGNIILRNLTTSVNTLIPVNGPLVSISQNVLTINSNTLLAWGNNYAVHIAAGAIQSNTGIPFAGIADDTTWNFTTLPGHPVVTAAQALEDHLTNVTILTGAQIAVHKATMDAEKNNFDESAETIDAVLDLIATYDATKGPLFVSGSTVTGFDRNNTDPTSKSSVSNENIHWVIYSVMQSIMDGIYNSPAIAAHQALLDGYKFGSSANFPGPCAPPAPGATHTIAINGSFPTSFGRETQQWTTRPARKPTGTYLAPGTIATVTVPLALVNQGYLVRVGAHSWDLKSRIPVERLERATIAYPINATTIKVASPYGGGIYIEVPPAASAGVVNVTVAGAVRAPYFSAKSFHSTTPAEWDIERTHPAPWADFQSEKFMLQVPRTWIYNHPSPALLLSNWDLAMDTINDLMGFPRDRGKETMYLQTDIILRSSVHAPGYPAVNVSSSPTAEVSPAGYSGNYLVRGPGASPTAAHIEFHEQGHAYFFPKFSGESESNVNLLQPAVLHRKFGYDLDTAQRASLGSGNVNRTLDNTAVAWMCVFNFSPREVPMVDAEKAYQHKGHAKFLDIVRLFGWTGLDTYWRSFMEDDANNITYGESTDDLLLRLCKCVGKDIRPLFHFWGIHPQNPATLAASLAAANIPSDPSIRDLLLHYQTLVPANNAAFRTFALAWWGKQPSINGYWEEREHARQWDTTALYGPGDQQRSEATNPGEIYNENSANDITARVQELLDLYFPAGIAPNPMNFAIVPAAVDPTTIGMTAATATAPTGPITYYFENVTAGNNSGWITNNFWNHTGLTTGQSYSFRVKARDGAAVPNETGWSALAAATAAADLTPPSPDPMSFANAPAAVDETTITMSATAATDVNGVEYEFEAVSGGGDSSGWQAGPTYTDAGLNPSTEYGYRVRARDSSGNVTGWSAPAVANTANIPDLTPPMLLSRTPANGSTLFNASANLVATFDEPIVINTGSITIRNLTDNTETIIDVTSPAVTITGGTLTINPPADFVIGKTYAIRIAATAVADVSSNPFLGIPDDSTWSFAMSTQDPIANPGGPYTVLIGGSLALNGSGSLPSDGATITSYQWDLDNNGTFGDVTGATPAAINFVTLTGSYGMVGGANPIQLRVTDSAAKISTVQGTVTLITFYTYTGTNGAYNSDRWNTTTHWTPQAFPSGTIDVEIEANRIPWAINATPAYTGKLTLRSGATLGIGATTGNNTVNALGTGPITMESGSKIIMRYDGTYIFNQAFVLTGPATVQLSESTNGGNRSRTFASSITGAHAFTLLGTNGNIANLNTANAFASLTASVSGSANYKVVGNAAGSLGAGNVTINTGLNLVIANSTAISQAASLYLNGVRSTKVAGEAKLVLSQSLTVAGFWLDGVQLAAGTYTSASGLVDSGANALISGGGTLTVTGAPAGNPFANWADDYPGLTNTNASLDFDGGSLPTGIEWVVGGNPSIGSDDTALSPTIDRTTDPNGKLLFIFRRTTAAKNDANTIIAVEYGSTLAGWTPAVHQGTAANQITITEQTNGFAAGIDKVTVALPPSLAATGKFFARLKVMVATQ